MNETAYRLVLVAAFILGTLVRGFICGMVPAAVSLKRGNTTYAKRSVLICMGVSLFLDQAISALVSLILLIVVLKRVPAPPREAVAQDLLNRFTHR